MCGYLGRLSFSKFDHNELIEPNEKIICRGPDSNKHIFSNEEDINYSLIFNRLSILDLSSKADQPMFSEDGKKILMFNGEVYNHTTLRSELEKKGINFKTSHSDSEVILKGIEKEGVEYVKKLRGQFSIFYMDQIKKKIYLIRDRLGQKPLYYFMDKENFVFGSNLKSLVQLNKNKEVNSKQIYEYLMYGIVGSPETIIKDYYKLVPSQLLEIDYRNSEFVLSKSIYWNLESNIDNKDFDKEEFFSIFNESVKLRAHADVPVANFLSGGLDSTSIIKNMNDNNMKINSFTIAVNNSDYDESQWANLVSEKFNTNHKTVQISSKVSFDDIDESICSLDEPYADPSIIPSYLISKEISKYFKVAISGDGGDELLGGYLRTNLTLGRSTLYSNLFSNLYSLYPGFLGTGNFFLSRNENLEVAYASFLEDKKFLNLLGVNPDTVKKRTNLKEGLDDYKSLIISDYNFYLPEMMLFKIDRASMANSLEVRSPFVDHVLIEYILSHNTNYFSQSNPKSLLKEYLRDDFDNEFINRKKQGFVFDIESWIFKNQNYFFGAILEGRLGNYLDTKAIKYLKINKSRINSHRIWKLFVLERYLSKL